MSIDYKGRREYLIFKIDELLGNDDTYKVFSEENLAEYRKMLIVSKDKLSKIDADNITESDIETINSIYKQLNDKLQEMIKESLDRMLKSSV